jgi:sugar phosphate isomerase/epimerase
MRLGGPTFGKHSSPEEWTSEIKELGYGAAYCPLSPDADDATVRDYEKAAREADIVIAEVGAWSNPLSPDEDERKKALEKCRAGLQLADRIGARCCVNIAGSRGEKWDGHHPASFTDETFDMIVEIVRAIIDDVKPARSFYTLEAMPWMYPDSPDEYARLMEAIDRERFAVHLDPVNIVASPRLYYDNTSLLKECFARLGPKIKSCHAKDIAFSQNLTVHLDEIRPGLGGLDYRTYLTELDKLEGDVPLMLEHLASAEDYAAAAEHIRSVAKEAGVAFR